MADYSGRSPYEVAEDEGRLDEFLKATSSYYGKPADQRQTGVNWYDQSTYGGASQPAASAPAQESFDPNRVPAGVPAEWAKNFIANNPGDYGRLGSAYQDPAPSQNASPAQQWNATPQVQRDPRADALYDQLLQRSQQSLTPGTSDPAIRGQADAFSANQERARRNYLSDVAERSGPYANLQGERRMASERYGQTTGSFEAELVGREVEARRQEIAQALSQLQGVLSNDQEAALRRELAALEATLQREGFGLQRYGVDLSNDQFLRELALRQNQFDEGLNYNYWLNL